MNDFAVELDDLELGDITVTALYDAVGLPETGASAASGHSCACASCGSCCCVDQQPPTA